MSLTSQEVGSKWGQYGLLFSSVIGGCKTGRSVGYVWCKRGRGGIGFETHLYGTVQKFYYQFIRDASFDEFGTFLLCPLWKIMCVCRGRLRDGRGDACRVLIFCPCCPDIHFAALALTLSRAASLPGLSFNYAGLANCTRGAGARIWHTWAWGIR